MMTDHMDRFRKKMEKKEKNQIENRCNMQCFMHKGTIYVIKMDLQSVHQWKNAPIKSIF